MLAKINTMLCLVMILIMIKSLATAASITTHTTATGGFRCREWQAIYL